MKRKRIASRGYFQDRENPVISTGTTKQSQWRDCRHRLKGGGRAGAALEARTWPAAGAGTVQSARINSDLFRVNLGICQFLNAWNDKISLPLCEADFEIASNQCWRGQKPVSGGAKRRAGWERFERRIAEERIHQRRRLIRRSEERLRMAREAGSGAAVAAGWREALAVRLRDWPKLLRTSERSVRSMVG